MPHLNHLHSTYSNMNDTEQYINHRHRIYYCINFGFVLFPSFTIILLLAWTFNFSWNFKKNIYLKISIKKCRKCLEINLVYFVLAQLYPRKAMSQPSCFDIEYWKNYRPFLCKQSQLIKMKKCLHRITLFKSYSQCYKLHHYQGLQL